MLEPASIEEGTVTVGEIGMTTPVAGNRELAPGTVVVAGLGRHSPEILVGRCRSPCAREIHGRRG
jgi:hypothetical protein